MKCKNTKTNLKINLKNEIDLNLNSNQIKAKNLTIMKNLLKGIDWVKNLLNNYDTNVGGH